MLNSDVWRAQSIPEPVIMPSTPGKLVMRAPVAPGCTVELYVLGIALDLGAIGILRDYLDLIERGMRLSAPAEPDAPSTPASDELAAQQGEGD